MIIYLCGREIMKKIKLDLIVRKIYYLSMFARLYIWITDKFLLKLFFEKITDKYKPTTMQNKVENFIWYQPIKINLIS